MRLVYERDFLKDITAIQDVIVKNKIDDIIRSVAQAGSFRDLNSVKKLKGYKNAYRIRIGNYRMGFFIEGGTVILVRVMHRSKIYKIFP